MAKAQSQLAQSVEHRSYEPKVTGSIPVLRTQSGKLLGEASALKAEEVSSSLTSDREHGFRQYSSKWSKEGVPFLATPH